MIFAESFEIEVRADFEDFKELEFCFDLTIPALLIKFDNQRQSISLNTTIVLFERNCLYNLSAFFLLNVSGFEE